MAITPTGDSVLVRPSQVEQTTESGIFIPDSVKNPSQEGVVLAVGPGRVSEKGIRVPVDVTEGDTVMYSKYGGTEVNYQGESLLILSARDILAVI